jgi:formylglycine-generating enzyme required for sulfatase activity
MNNFIFISYAREDKEHALRLESDLRNRGVKAFRDERSIEPDESFVQKIQQAINQSTIVAILWSERADNSRWVERERLAAEEINKPRIVLSVDELVKLPLDLKSLSPLDYINTPERSVEKLVQRFHDIEGTSGSRRDELQYLNELIQREELELSKQIYVSLHGELEQQKLDARFERMPQHIRVLMRDACDITGTQNETHHYDDILQAVTTSEQAVILGEPGCGKTMSLRRFALDLAEKARKDNKAPLPLFVKLNAWISPHKDQPPPTFEAFLDQQLAPLGSTRRAELVKEQRAIFLLDGLNELPTAVRENKIAAIKRLLLDHKALPCYISCRQDDYQEKLADLLDEIHIEPLAPTQIRRIINKHMVDTPADADALFWQLAGGSVDDGAALKTIYQRCQIAGIGLDDYLASARVFEEFDYWDRYQVERILSNPRRLYKLAQNPFMLIMFIGVYKPSEGLPRNRATLFSKFINYLFLNEQHKKPLALTELAKTELLEQLRSLAWGMQNQALSESLVNNDTERSTVQLSLPRQDAEKHLTDKQLKLAADAGILEVREEVRFSHQLLQEYFIAKEMQVRIESRELKATNLWPHQSWWERSGWEEATYMLADYYDDKLEELLLWLYPTQPEVAAELIQRSPQNVPAEILTGIKEHWLPQLTDESAQPHPYARAAIGRALGGLRFYKRPLDDRRGVWGYYDGEEKKAVISLDLVEIPDGEFIYQGEKRHMDTFWLSRYPVTCSQFQAFIDDPQGYQNTKWRQGLEQNEWQSLTATWDYSNHPRSEVNWYEAIAYCRWLTALLELPENTITLPTEEQWERAAAGNEGNEYPWGRFQSGRANIHETSGTGKLKGDYDLGKISPVGMYVSGQSAEGVMDLSGNVWEWCLNKYEKPDDSNVDNSGASRVLRGGSWIRRPELARAAFRDGYYLVVRYDLIGFRLLSSLPLTTDH